MFIVNIEGQLQVKMCNVFSVLKHKLYISIYSVIRLYSLSGGQRYIRIKQSGNVTNTESLIKIYIQASPRVALRICIVLSAVSERNMTDCQTIPTCKIVLLGVTLITCRLPLGHSTLTEAIFSTTDSKRN